MNQDEHSRCLKDTQNAVAMMGLFFDQTFINSKAGSMHKDSLLLRQADRGMTLPDRRSYNSITTMSKELWAEWDALTEVMKKSPSMSHEIKPKREKFTVMCKDYPIEWQKAIRPIIAKRKYTYKSTP